MSVGASPRGGKKNVDVACFLGFDLIFEHSRKERNNA